MRRGKDTGTFAVRAIAVCHIVFGLAAMIFEGYDMHFLILIVLGVFAAASCLGARPARSAS